MLMHLSFIIMIFPRMSLHCSPTLTIRIWPIRRKEKKSLLRVAKLLNLAPRSLADEAKSVIWSKAICIE